MELGRNNVDLVRTVDGRERLRAVLNTIETTPRYEKLFKWEPSKEERNKQTMKSVALLFVVILILFIGGKYK